MERCLRAAAAAAGAGSRLIVGVDDDWLKWTASPDRIVRAYGHLNLGAVRVTLRWQPGEPQLDTVSRLHLRRIVNGAPGTVRIVLAVYGSADQAPRRGCSGPTGRASRRSRRSRRRSTTC